MPLTLERVRHGIGSHRINLAAQLRSDQAADLNWARMLAFVCDAVITQELKQHKVDMMYRISKWRDDREYAVQCKLQEKRS